jgi:hypothetical protein
VDLLIEYQQAKDLLDFYKEEEHDLRLEVIETFFPNASEGTFTKSVEGFEIKGGFKYNISIDKEMLGEKMDEFTDEESCCIQFTPALVKSEYKKLSASERSHLDDCLIIKPALPTLTLTETETEK